MKTSLRVALRPFKFGDRTAFVLEFGANYIRFYAKHGQVQNDEVKPYEIASPYTLSDIYDAENKCYKLWISQLADVIYIFHPAYPVKTLTRYGNTDWRLGDFDIKNGPWESVNKTDTALSASGSTGEITITANGGSPFAETDTERLIRLTLLNDTTEPWAAGKEVSQGKIMKSDNKFYRALSSGTTGSYKPTFSEGSQSDGAVNWEYLHAGYGTAKIIEIISATEVKAEVIDFIPAGINTTYWELGLLHKGATYPACGTFFRNRLFMLIDTPSGPKALASCTNDFNNFADKDHGEVLPESAFEAPILSDEFNSVRWIGAGDVLFIGTSGGEFYLDVSSAAEALGPENYKVMPISKIGGKSLPPIKINGHMLFVDKFGTSIRDLVYSYERDGYDPFDASILGKHLLSSGIVDWAYQDVPDKVLWCVVDDGRMIGFTFNIEQQVMALHQQRMSGYTETIAVIPSPDQNREDVWVCVKRTIDSVTQRYVEWQDEGMPSEFPDIIDALVDIDEKETQENEYIQENAFYVDSGLIYNRPSGSVETKITGLDHLKGMTVAIMADGAQRPNQIVNENGEITIRSTDVRVTVGLPITSIYKSQNLYIQSQTSTEVGAVQQIDHLLLMLYRSSGGKVGGKFKSLVDILYRKTDDQMNEPTPLFSGNKLVPWPNGASTIEEKGADVIIVNDSVFPMNVLAVSPQMSSFD